MRAAASGAPIPVELGFETLSLLTKLRLTLPPGGRRTPKETAPRPRRSISGLEDRLADGFNAKFSQAAAAD